MRDNQAKYEESISAIYRMIVSNECGAGAWHKLHARIWLARIEHLFQDAESTLTSHRLHVQCDECETADIVLNSLRSDPEPSILDVWLFDPSEDILSDVAWKKYFVRVVEMAREGALSEIRTVVIMPDGVTPIHPQLRALFSLYRNTHGFGCRWLANAQYTELASEAGFNDLLEFAVYGSQLVFRTTSFVPPAGDFIAGNEEISRWRMLFEGLWQLSTIEETNINDPQVETVEKLVAVDRRRPQGAE